MRQAYLLLLLHAHLPFVRHPEQEGCVQERWLFQAIIECYLPLLACLRRLHADAVRCRITLSLSPTLMTMLDDPLLRQRFSCHLQGLIALARDQSQRAGWRADLAQGYLHDWSALACDYEDRYGQDLLDAFRRFEALGLLELITTAATHGYLPLLQRQPAAVRAQLRLGRDLFQHRFGHPPAGVWLPECGYYPGLERELAQQGYRYFFLDSHALRNARPRPVHGTQQPVACGGLAAFARDADCATQVWSREQGYPGHAQYREYHHDMGNELTPAQLGAAGLPAGEAGQLGLKLHRITDKTNPNKQAYDPLRARAQAEADGKDFVLRRLRAIGSSELRDRPVLFVAPYDAELFGHWWYEGPVFLEQVVRQTALSDGLEMVSASDYLKRHPVLPRVQPSASSWGEGGYNAYWLNQSNAWLYPHLQQAATRLQRGIDGLRPAQQENGLQTRCLNQALRSLLLAQASDWPFIMRSGQSADYAVKRVTDCLSRFDYLMQSLETQQIDPRRLQALEYLDPVFPQLDALEIFGRA